MLVKIVHVKYCPANWQTALQQHRFPTFGGCHPPPPTVTPLGERIEVPND